MISSKPRPLSLPPSPQPGDVLATFAGVDDLTRDVGFQPATPIEVGVGRFVTWFRGYYMHEECAHGSRSSGRGVRHPGARLLQEGAARLAAIEGQ